MNSTSNYTLVEEKNVLHPWGMEKISGISGHNTWFVVDLMDMVSREFYSRDTIQREYRWLL
jgi:hypothetical protein